MKRNLPGPYRFHPKRKRLKLKRFSKDEWKYLKTARSVEDSLDAEFGPTPPAPRYGTLPFSGKFK